MKLQANIIKQGPLSRREATVLKLLCTGLLRQQIADTLHRSYSSISKHIESIAVKLDAHSAAEIVSKAVALGLVDISIKACLLIVFFNVMAINIDMRRPPKLPFRTHTARTAGHRYDS